jgi:hypothetical protein
MSGRSRCALGYSTDPHVSAGSLSGSHPNRAAVLLLAFNRPDLLERVLEGLDGLQARQVFASIDGPRPSRPEERAQCARVREIVEAIDGVSELKIKAEETNLGCGPAVSSAISWALSEVTEIIVIEDDCLPDPSFLSFCDELLERYRHDERVMHIAGTNWGADAGRYDGYSYAFTSFAPIWGWATWRRAWEMYDYELESWPRVKQSGLASGMAISARFRRLLERDWDLVRAGGGTWDHQWQYAVMRHHGLSVSPAANMVINMGQGANATQQRGESDRIVSTFTLGSTEFPLRHPPEVARNASVESVFERVYWQKFGWPGRLYRSLTNQRVRRLIGPLVPPPT